MHKFQNGICTTCGCDKNAIEYFGWACTSRSIQHIYVNDTCINCGFCKAVISHFDWPCRFDYRAMRTDRTFHRAADQRTEDRHSGYYGHRSETRQLADDENRYGRLLGLKGRVTVGDIEYAYYKQAVLYHPDKVAHLAPEIQEFATVRMRDINNAFQYFKSKYGL